MRVGTGLRGAVGGILLFLVNVPASAGVGPAISDEKKLIVWAVNAVEASYLPKHITTIEEWWPIDGIVVAVYPDDWKFRRTGQEDVLFGGKKITRDDFKQTLADLKATRFNRYTDNFIHVAAHARGGRYAGAEYGNLDWFDPNWSVVAENGATVAWLAKEAGFKGIFFDVEFYAGGPTPPWKSIFSYELRPDRNKKSFEDVAAQVRMRGREWMEQVTAAYPDIAIVVIQSTSAWRRNRTVLPWQMADEDAALVPHFVEGMLERQGNATIIDGIEIGYWCSTYDTFKALKEEAETRGFEDIKHAFGIFLDADSTTGAKYEGFYTKPEEMEKNFRSPRRFEHTLYDALSVSDRYAWIYLQHAPHFINPAPPNPQGILLPWNICPQCPHTESPDQYAPGLPKAYTDAFRNCRKPHEFNGASNPPMPRRIDALYPKMANGKNLLRNGSFEEWVDATGQPKDWQVRGNPSRERRFVKDGSNSLVMSDVGYYNWIEQTIPAESCAGKTVLFGAWVRASSRDMLHLELLGYHNSEYTLASSDHYPGDGAWQFLVGEKTVPADATGELWFRFHIRSRLPDGKVYLDGARVVIEE